MRTAAAPTAWDEADEESASFIRAVVGDGRPLLLIVIGALAFAGGFAVFLGATREFLPHDLHFLGMTADELCRVASCRVVDFMVHDRVAWGRTMMGSAVLWAWLVIFPLSRGQVWAWWTLVLSGSIGFSSFLGYLAYGYFDSWHGFGILLMLIPFIAGLIMTRQLVGGDPGRRSLRWRPHSVGKARFDTGWSVLLAGAIGTAVGGLTILWVGVTATFVPEDLAFMATSAGELRGVSDRLVPLIAHDRVGFGGGVTTMGVTTAMCLWFAAPSRHLFQAILLAGGIALTAAIGTHFFVGYTDTGHLLPALAAAADLGFGLALIAPGVPNPVASRQQAPR